MGLGLLSKSSFDGDGKKNPDPKKCKVLESYQLRNIEKIFTVLKVKYFNCTNYEGIKILVYKNISYPQLVEQFYSVGLDPHFSLSEKWASPIARFEPTDEGLRNAFKFCAVA